MLVGGALMALSWVFVRYNGISGDRVLLWVLGSVLFIIGMMRAMVLWHATAFGG